MQFGSKCKQKGHATKIQTTGEKPFITDWQQPVAPAECSFDCKFECKVNINWYVVTSVT